MPQRPMPYAALPALLRLARLLPLARMARLVCLVCLVCLACLPPLASPARAAKTVGSQGQASDGSLHMWQDKDGALNIQDRKPQSLDALPPTRRQEMQLQGKTPEPPQDSFALPAQPPAPSGKSGQAGQTGQAGQAGQAAEVKPVVEEKHPLQELQEQHAAAPSPQAPAVNLDPNSNPMLKLMLSDPKMKADWDAMPLEQKRQTVLQFQMAQQMMGQHMPGGDKMMEGMLLMQQFGWIFNLVSIICYFWWAWIHAKLGAMVGVGSFIQFLVPLWNVYLYFKTMLRINGLNPWSLLLFIVPIVNVIYWFHFMAKTAQKLGKNYWVWGVLLLVTAPFMFLFIGLIPWHMLAKQAADGTDTTRQASAGPLG